MDQADKLRELAKVHRPAAAVLNNKRTIAVASGKGGVGKTNFSVNISIALNQLGQKVILLDADLGMANIDVLCGLSPKYNLGHVINNKKSFGEIVIECCGGINVIPGVSGVEELTSLNLEQQQIFFEQLEIFDKVDMSKILVIDIGAGMAPTVINFLLASNESIIITTPEPTAMMDAYAIIKTIVGKKPDADISIIVNMVKSKEEAVQVFHSMSMITQQFLNHQLQYLGHILSDPVVSKCVKQQSPFLLSYPHSQASKCVREIALRLLNRKDTVHRGGIKNLFERLGSFFGG
ncbi:MAG: MinD/ParA family protein [Candidatus Margulisiibacteriota bacterium]|nr:MAG: MinD/ParA family protein [Candidatus Margulisiibacteriota bacterium]HAR64506.1 ATP-binding protein [Candidatus Margulisiibacteriota bacterium]HCT84545.1 ATP-binding protein [Candidatus Margulisiibacteriota bacterium]HCY37059.1 ATP-binding protein [Candidatus Margulisiibacteriota bacterium]